MLLEPCRPHCLVYGGSSSSLSLSDELISDRFFDLVVVFFDVEGRFGRFFLVFSGFSPEIALSPRT